MLKFASFEARRYRRSLVLSAFGCTSGVTVSFSRLSGRQAYVDLMKVNRWSIAHIICRATQADEESIGTFRGSRAYQDRAETVPCEMTSGTYR